MAFRTSSTRRSTAASAVSSQAVIINSGNAAVAGTTPSFAVSGSSIQANSVISLGVVTVGQNSATSTTTIASGPTITNIAYLDTTNTIVAAQTAVSTAGGNILITGTNFVANSNVVINGNLVTNTFVSSTQIRAVLPAASNGNVSLYIFSPTNVGTASSRLIRYSGAPTWNVTSATFTNGTASNIALSVTSDSTLTYTTLNSLSAANLTLSSDGYLSGTPTGYTSDTSLFPTFVATDQEGQATQTAFTISISVADANFANTAILTKSTGVNAGNNQAFTDSSTNAMTITTTGTPGQGTFSPFSPTGWSNYFGGSGDYLSTSANASFAFGTGDYTIEAWIYRLDSGVQRAIVDLRGGANVNVLFYILSTNKLAAFNSTSTWITSTGSIPANQWTHVALSRSGTSAKLFINGTVDGTATNSDNNGSAGTPYIGRQFGSTTNDWYGTISNLRIVKGQALYTTNFTPSTTPLTTTSQGATASNVSLLTCQSNRFLDNSTNAFVLTPTATASVYAWSPFAPGTTWSAATHGGSINFNINTTGGYITATNATAFDQDVDFTVEMWVYVTAYPGSNDAKMYQPNGSGTLAIAISTTGKINIDDQQTGNKIVSTATVYKSTWYHLALIRNGPTTNNLILYINGSADTTTSYTNWQTSATFAEIGRRTDTSTDFNGYISGLRVVRGTAVYTGAFTPPTSPLTAIANTSFLLKATDASVYDAHASHNLSTFGGAQLSTARAKYATTSLLFNGTSAYATSTPTSLYSFGTGDFTVEFWLNFTATTNRQDILDWYVSASDRGGIKWNVAAGNLTYYISPITANAINVAWTPSTNTWYHIALVRSSGVSKFYIDGVGQTPTYNDNRNYNTATYSLHLGKDSAAASSWFNGYLEDIRVSRVARYVANFTPPSGAFIAQ